MSIIEQLEQSVTPAVLGNNSSVAHVSLLEQFYAILAARLALPEVYSQLLRSDSLMVTDSVTESPLFEQLWQAPSMRQTIIQELAATHHIDELTTTQLLINAAPLAYRELKALASGQFLPAFLQKEQPALRQYLPLWSAPVITAAQNISQSSNDSNVMADSNIAAMAVTPIDNNNTPHTNALTSPIEGTIEEDAIENSSMQPHVSVNLDKHNNTDLNPDSNTVTNAIHANPAAHHLAENGSIKRKKIRSRNQRNDLLIRVSLLLVTVAALGFAAWALLIKPNRVAPVEPVATVPVVVPPPIEPAPQVLTPIELIIGVDDSGSLYTCSATVGDEALQSTLQQAINTSFGEQAGICELTIRAGVANSMANVPAEVLPNILTMLRSTPFARLHLQNNRMTLEAPDSMLLQRLVTDIRALAPAMMIDSAAPLPLPNNNNAVDDMTTMNSQNPQFESDASAADNTDNNDAYSNNGASAQDYQATDDDTGDSMMPAPARNNPVRSNNGNLTNIPSNSTSSTSTNNRPSGPISLSEVDDMASNVIVAEPARVRNK